MSRRLTRVAAAVLTDDQARVLIGKRRASAVHGGLWEFPGGKIERGESPQECLARELREELRIHVDVGPIFARVVLGGRLDLVAYRVSLVDGIPAAIWHEEIAWANPAELASQSVPPADEPIVDFLGRMEQGRSVGVQLKLPAEIGREVARWTAIWGTPHLATCVLAEWSDRMTASLGRSYPQRWLIRLNSALRLPANHLLLAETLCHELAHVVAFLVHGRRAGAHGDVWQQLVSAAGHVPRVGVPATELRGP